MPSLQLQRSGAAQVPGGRAGLGGYGQPYSSLGSDSVFVPDSSITGIVSTMYRTYSRDIISLSGHLHNSQSYHATLLEHFGTPEIPSRGTCMPAAHITVYNGLHPQAIVPSELLNTRCSLQSAAGDSGT